MEIGITEKGLALLKDLDAHASRYPAAMLGHLGPKKLAQLASLLGEILQIHNGRQPDPEWAFHDWLHSPTHLAVMLDPLFTYIGGGYTVGRFYGFNWRFSGRDDTIWVVHFGRL